MPLETMASAACLIRSSLTLQENLFQLFQPMGGVRANPLSSARNSPAATRKPRAAIPKTTRPMRTFVSMSLDYHIAPSRAFSHPRMSLGNRYRICGSPFFKFFFVHNSRGADGGEAGQRLGLGWFWFSFSLEGFCVLMPELSVVPQGRPTGGWAPSHADVA